MDDAAIVRFRVATGDNYQYLLTSGTECLIVDPFDPAAVLRECASRELSPAGILITHTHWDHTNGVAGIVREFDVPVYVHPRGASDVTGNICTVIDGDEIALGDERCRIHEAPGHHPAHIIATWSDVLVVGDVLFLAGCGNPNFGGNVDQLYETVVVRLAEFDAHWRLAWGHDYADKNLAFAQTIEPENAAIAATIEMVRQCRAAGEDIPWRTLGEEREINPFLRCGEATVIAAARAAGAPASDPATVFRTLRGLRDHF